MPNRRSGSRSTSIASHPNSGPTYDYPSGIISPVGTVLAAAPIGEGPAVATADLDVTQRFPQDSIGDWGDAYQRQQRPTAYGKKGDGR